MKPFERIKALTKANHPVGMVMYYVESYLIIMGAIRIDWVKLRISKLQFLIILRSGLYRMVTLKSLGGHSCSALSDVFTSIHGGFVKLCSSGLWIGLLHFWTNMGTQLM